VDSDIAMGEGDGVRALSDLPLYWRVCIINGSVFVAATVALAFSPASVSRRVLVSEAIVLVLGLFAMLLLNAVLLRRSLAPIDRLIRLVEGVDLAKPGQRLPEAGPPAVSRAVGSINLMLDRIETERHRSNALALAAQEAERNRIASELHDEIGQGLTVVLLGLKRIADTAPDAVAAELRPIQEAARSSLDEVRLVARRLRPDVLDDLGLVSALTALATDVSGSSGIHVRRGFARGLPELTPDVELVIYRIAQEALTNAARHSAADTIELGLTRQGNAVALRVADNGRGLLARPEGAGIRGMRERARLVGGQLSIGPRGGGGTEVRLVVASNGRA
jgi:two-component system sensor histidine kinase UhpB